MILESPNIVKHLNVGYYSDEMRYDLGVDKSYSMNWFFKIGSIMDKSCELIKQYIDIAGVIFVVIDAEQKVSLINNKGCEILGYKKEDIEGKNWFDNFVPDKSRKKVSEAYNKLILGEIELVEYFENIIVTSRGEERVISWHNTVIRDDEGNITSTLSSGEDITERKKAETELKRLKENLETEVLKKSKELLEAQDKVAKAERLAVLGKLAGMVAHELRTPLGVIKHKVYYLKNNLISLMKDNKVISHLNIIDSEVNSSDKIIEDILSFARIKEPNLKTCSFDHIIKKSVSVVDIPENIDLKIEMDGELPDAMLDSSQMKLVFANIIMNAVQSMPDGGSLSIEGSMEDHHLKVMIIDAGEGISEENISKIFDVLFTTKIRGTGLGLSVCQSIVNLHGGTIGVESKEGSGTTFTVTLPTGRSPERITVKN